MKLARGWYSLVTCPPKSAAHLRESVQLKRRARSRFGRDMNQAWGSLHYLHRGHASSWARSTVLAVATFMSLRFCSNPVFRDTRALRHRKMRSKMIMTAHERLARDPMAWLQGAEGDASRARKLIRSFSCILIAPIREHCNHHSRRESVVDAKDGDDSRLSIIRSKPQVYELLNSPAQDEFRMNASQQRSSASTNDARQPYGRRMIQGVTHEDAPTAERSLRSASRAFCAR